MLTAALLTYRPPSVALLRGAVGFLQGEEAKRRFARNTQSFILQALAPKFERETYSVFCERLDGHAKAEDNRTGSEIINDLIAKWEGK